MVCQQNNAKVCQQHVCLKLKNFLLLQSITLSLDNILKSRDFPFSQGAEIQLKKFQTKIFKSKNKIIKMFVSN
jgi:hypothetical protein